MAEAEALFSVSNVSREGSVRESHAIGKVRMGFDVDDAARIHEPEPERPGHRRDPLAHVHGLGGSAELEPGDVEVAPGEQGSSRAVERVAARRKGEGPSIDRLAFAEPVEIGRPGSRADLGIAERGAVVADDALDRSRTRTLESNHVRARSPAAGVSPWLRTRRPSTMTGIFRFTARF